LGSLFLETVEGEAVGRAAASAIQLSFEDFIDHLRRECFPRATTKQFRQQVVGTDFKQQLRERLQTFEARLSAKFNGDWWQEDRYLSVLVEELVFLPGYRRCLSSHTLQRNE
jgi:hypothetical protein